MKSSGKSFYSESEYVSLICDEERQNFLWDRKEIRDRAGMLQKQTSQWNRRNPSKTFHSEKYRNRWTKTCKQSRVTITAPFTGPTPIWGVPSLSYMKSVASDRVESPASHLPLLTPVPFRPHQRLVTEF